MLMKTKVLPFNGILLGFVVLNETYYHCLVSTLGALKYVLWVTFFPLTAPILYNFMKTSPGSFLSLYLVYKFRIYIIK